MSSDETESEGVHRRDVLKSAGFAAGAMSLAGEKVLTIGDDPDLLQEDPAVSEELTSTACWVGKQNCGLKTKTVGNRIVSIQGHENDPRSGGGLCPKGFAQIDQVYDPYRIKAPLKRTNEKGKEGSWKEISWEQALTEIGESVKPKLEDDPKKVLFNLGRGKGSAWHWGGFVGAVSERYGGAIQKAHHGDTCCLAAYRTSQLMFSQYSAATADTKHTDYLIIWGAAPSKGGTVQACSLKWTNLIQEAKESGTKVVYIDPQRQNAGPYPDEWLPIKPGTDLALAQAMGKVLVDEGYIDETYLKFSTNSPCLVNPDSGTIQRGEDAEDPIENPGWANGELVYDAAAEEIVPHEEAEDPALTGEYTLSGSTVKPAFQLYKETISDKTPEWAAEITGIEAETIRRIAEEFGEAAKIGETTTVDGNEIPKRPAAILGLNRSPQQELGVGVSQSGFQLAMLVGSIEVVGATMPRNRHKAIQTGEPDLFWRKWLNGIAYNAEEAISDEPDRIDLNHSKYHPISSGGYTNLPQAANNPDKYGIPYEAEEMAAFLQMSNPVMAANPTDDLIEAWSRFDTVVVADPVMSETASVAGDYVLPAATLDKYEGPLGLDAATPYTWTEVLRTQPIEPLYETKADGDIWTNVADALDAGDEYVSAINGSLGLSDENAFSDIADLNVEDALKRWAQNQGKTIDDYKDPEEGVQTEELPLERKYAYFWPDRGTPSPYGMKHNFYLEQLELMGERVTDLGLSADEYPYVQDYNGLPKWREPTFKKSPEEYDLTLLSFKKIEKMQSRSANNTLLNEIDPQTFARINPETAEERGLEDGDMVTVTSHNALTGETRSIEAPVLLMDGIRPGVVSMPHGNGSWTKPVAKLLDEGPLPNNLIPAGPGYEPWTGDQAYQVKVKVEKTDGGGT